MGFIWLGIALILIGIVLSLFVPLGGMLAQVGWLVLIVGLILAVLSFLVPRGRTI